MNNCFEDEHVFEVEASMPPNRTLECQCGKRLTLKAWITAEQIICPLRDPLVVSPEAAEIVFMSMSGAKFL